MLDMSIFTSIIYDILERNCTLLMFLNIRIPSGKTYPKNYFQFSIYPYIRLRANVIIDKLDMRDTVGLSHF